MFQLKDYLDNEKDIQLMMSFLTYMMSLTNIIPEYLTTITRQISEKREDIVMSNTTRLREEGINEVITKGKLETAQKMLLKGFSVQEIAEITDISEKEINSLKKKR